MQGAGAGQPHPVAGLAEIVAERCNQAQAATGFGDPHIARRTTGRERQVLQRPETLQLAPHLGQREVLIGAIRLDLAQRHGLDQRQIVALAMRPADQVRDLARIVVLEGDGVDLDRQSSRPRRSDSRLDLGQVAAARQFSKQVRLQRVH